MADDKRLIQLLGLMMRAGDLVTGVDMVVDSVRRGKACHVFLDKGLSAASTKKLTDACLYHQTPLTWMEADTLGLAMGKANRQAAALTNARWLKTLQQ